MFEKNSKMNCMQYHIFSNKTVLMYFHKQKSHFVFTVPVLRRHRAQRTKHILPLDCTSLSQLPPPPPPLLQPGLSP